MNPRTSVFTTENFFGNTAFLSRQGKKIECDFFEIEAEHLSPD